MLNGVVIQTSRIFLSSLQSQWAAEATREPSHCSELWGDNGGVSVTALALSGITSTTWERERERGERERRERERERGEREREREREERDLYISLHCTELALWLTLAGLICFSPFVALFCPWVSASTRPTARASFCSNLKSCSGVIIVKIYKLHQNDSRKDGGGGGGCTDEPLHWN